MSMKFLILFMLLPFLTLNKGNAASFPCYQPNQSTPVGKLKVFGLAGADMGEACHGLYPDACPDPRKDPTHQCSSSPAPLPLRSR